jgi:hypothetical protein
MDYAVLSLFLILDETNYAKKKPTQNYPDFIALPLFFPLMGFLYFHTTSFLEPKILLNAHSGQREAVSFN